MSKHGQFTPGNLLHTVTVCDKYHGPDRLPAPQDDTQAVAIGINIAARAASRPAFAQPIPVKQVVIDRSRLPLG